MNSPKQQPRAADADVRGILGVLLGALIVLLLVVANVQLANGGKASDSSGGHGVSKSFPVSPPVEETSNHVLAKELKQLSGKLTSPINLLREKLDPLSGLSAGQLAAASSIDELSESFRRIGAVRTELSQMSAGLGDVVGSTEAMAGNLGESTDALSGVDRNIGATRQLTRGMAKTMRRVEATIVSSGEATNDSMSRVGSGIEAMNEALTSQREELNASLSELNGNMTKFLKLMCVLLTSEPECS